MTEAGKPDRWKSLLDVLGVKLAPERRSAATAATPLAEAPLAAAPETPDAVTTTSATASAITFCGFSSPVLMRERTSSTNFLLTTPDTCTGAFPGI
ncbi:MAG: hypothetical protein ACKOUR_03585, partial [Planctomycetota bacterium]